MILTQSIHTNLHVDYPYIPDLDGQSGHFSSVCIGWRDVKPISSTRNLVISTLRLGLPAFVPQGTFTLPGAGSRHGYSEYKLLELKVWRAGREPLRSCWFQSPGTPGKSLISVNDNELGWFMWEKSGLLQLQALQEVRTRWGSCDRQLRGPCQASRKCKRALYVQTHWPVATSSRVEKWLASPDPSLPCQILSSHVFTTQSDTTRSKFRILKDRPFILLLGHRQNMGPRPVSHLL